ncbi:hypothetical protein GPECTOR_55g271 [Gonium pectorale]|uniref:BZIP domain-containing protein n=1 Tax=Gonium pectorale TaxID=33097 RepID=A0A150G745_GONPE|nr:hypothetical protein GPECTOR_55g271 [Gonium pectorale]|eukprot:KXZ45365.1 hypothetical protein GPECTOR_55g271 [Gonium pectorale]
MQQVLQAQLESLRAQTVAQLEAHKQQQALLRHLAAQTQAQAHVQAEPEQAPQEQAQSQQQHERPQQQQQSPFLPSQFQQLQQQPQDQTRRSVTGMVGGPGEVATSGGEGWSTPRPFKSKRLSYTSAHSGFSDVSATPPSPSPAASLSPASSVMLGQLALSSARGPPALASNGSGAGAGRGGPGGMGGANGAALGSISAHLGAYGAGALGDGERGRAALSMQHAHALAAGGGASLSAPPSPQLPLSAPVPLSIGLHPQHYVAQVVQQQVTRDKNREAQRRYRERQRDTLATLQARVDEQSALIEGLVRDKKMVEQHNKALLERVWRLEAALADAQRQLAGGSRGAEGTTGPGGTCLGPGGADMDLGEQPGPNGASAVGLHDLQAALAHLRRTAWNGGGFASAAPYGRSGGAGDATGADRADGRAARVSGSGARGQATAAESASGMGCCGKGGGGVYAGGTDGSGDDGNGTGGCGEVSMAEASGNEVDVCSSGYEVAGRGVEG